MDKMKIFRKIKQLGETNDVVFHFNEKLYLVVTFGDMFLTAVGTNAEVISITTDEILQCHFHMAVIHKKDISKISFVNVKVS